MMTEATEVRLEVDEHGDLVRDGNLIMWQFPAGDYDVLGWPLKDWKERMMLAEKLCEAREWTGELPQSVKTVVLPDGEKFVIEDELPSENHPRFEDWRAWLKDINPYRW